MSSPRSRRLPGGLWLAALGQLLLIAAIVLLWVVRDPHRGSGAGGGECPGFLSESVPCTGVEDPAWSPDGSRIAFASDRHLPHRGISHIFAFDLRSGRLRQLTFGDRYDAEPSWSPDGTRLVFVRFASDFDPDAGELYVLRLGDGRAFRLTRNRRSESMPSWSADGRRILFAVGSGTMSMPPVVGGRASRITSTPGVMSPDRRTVAYADDAIYLIDRAGAEPRALTHPPLGEIPDPIEETQDTTEVNDTSPAWSPDGRRIAFSRHRAVWARAVVGHRWEGRTSRIMVVDARGGSPTALTDGDLDDSPAWSPDGRRIAFSRHGELYVVNSDGTGIEHLARG